MRRKFLDTVLAVGVASAALMSASAIAQVSPAADQTFEEGEPAATAAAQDDKTGIEEILVTARKKTRAESMQEVPIAITAFGSQQIDEANLVTLADLGSRAPNVQTTSNGTFGGVAAFTIRGLAVNSSIPSLEPAVGVFVDGIYLGTNYGVVLDTFDLEAIEVLRGPQGTLQGRNVTGGAVMVRTRRPGDEFAVRARANVETGPEYTLAGSVEGPIVDDVLNAKITGYYRDDHGWFHNDFTNSRVGKNKTWFVRPSVKLMPASGFDLTAIYERGRTRGDGVVPQNAADPELRNFDLDYNEPGYTHVDWDAFTVEANLNVGFGDGTITNLFGVRSVEQDSLTDLDSSTASFFHAFAYLKQHQLSNELRYAGKFGPVDLTTGIFFFKQDYQYIERRLLLEGAIDRVFGGHIDQDSLGLFAQGDIELAPRLTATLGLRYSTEKKKANIDRSPAGTGASNCSYVTKTCPLDVLPKFLDEKRWDAFTPKIGLDWRASDDVLIYGSWSKGVRSGGYNVRSSSSIVPPGPYDPENQNAFEIGFKSDFADRKVRLNGAAFYNRMTDLQRDILFVAPPPEVGVVQVVRNAVDADIYGFEGELIVAPTRYLRFEGSVGYTNADYRNARFDLTGDGLIDEADEKLVPPRLAPWTYSVGATATQPIYGDVAATAHVDFGYRSRTPVNDANTVFARRRNMLNAFVAVKVGTKFEVSFYGKNLLNEAWNNVTTLVQVTSPRYTFSPLDEGRVFGLSIKGNY